MTIPPPQWSAEEFEVARMSAVTRFRDERLREPLEQYLELFDAYLGTVEDLLEATVDLTSINEPALEILTNAALLEAALLASPP